MEESTKRKEPEESRPAATDEWALKLQKLRAMKPPKPRVVVKPRRASTSSSSSSSGSSDSGTSSDSEASSTESEPGEIEAEDAAKLREYKKQKIAQVTSIEAATRTGGVYVPPFKMRKLLQIPADKESPAFQKLAWEALRKSLNGLVNKVNVSNIRSLVPELFQENLLWGQGLLTRAIMKAQGASPSMTHIYAALLAVINSKLPDVGLLVVHRVILQFRRAYQRNHKLVLTGCMRFVAHMINQQVVHHLLGLQILMLCLDKLTDDSIDVAVAFLTEIGKYLLENDTQAHHAICERLRSVLQEGRVEKRSQYTIDKFFTTIRKTNYQDHPILPGELDLLEEDDKICHSVDLLDDSIVANDMINVFKPMTPEAFRQLEAEWREAAQEVLGGAAGEDDDDASSVDSEAEEDQRQTDVEINTQQRIVDMTEQDLIHLRKTVYLALMSSATMEESVHKLMKMNVPEGAEIEVCTMLIDTCAMGKTYEKSFAMQAERLCRLNPVYQEDFVKCFHNQYVYVHRLDTAKGRNTAKFFAHLFFTDAVPWTAMECIKLTEESTTAASRIFVKNFMLEIAEHMGMETMSQRLKDPELTEYTAGIFPTNSPSDLRFSINFFTAIGLGQLTTDMRTVLLAASAPPAPR